MSYGFLFDAPTTLAAADDSWVQVAKAGTFKDPRYGSFKITTKEFDQWIAKFQALVLDKGREGLPVDVDHSPEKRGETEAVGWIKQLEKRNGELWAKVEWNTLGQELIKDKRYAYISPSYNDHFRNEQGEDIGTTLVGIALTNRPFLQMATVNLSQFTFAGDDDADDKGGKNDNDADDVGVPQSDVTELDEADGDKLDQQSMDDILDISDTQRQKHAVVVKKIGGTTKHMFPIPPGDKVHAVAALRLLPRAVNAGHITPAEASSIRQRAHEVLGTRPKSGSGSTSLDEAYSHRQMEITKVLTALNVTLTDLGLDESADETKVLSALTEHQLAKAAKPAPTPVPKDSVILTADQVQTLTSQAAAGHAAAETLRVKGFEDAFNKCLSDGKLVPAQKDQFKEMYDLNGDKTLALMDGLKPVVNMTPGGFGGSPENLDPTVVALSGQYTDSVTPMTVDQEQLKVLAMAERIEAHHKVNFEKALEMAESGVTV